MSTTTRFARRAASIAVLAPTIAVGMASASFAGAGGMPVLTTSQGSVPAGGTFQASGSGCTGFPNASVAWTSNPGTPQANVFKTDFPLTVDANGNFSSTAPSTGLAVGTIVTAVATCGSPLDDPKSAPLTFTVTQAATTTTTSSTSTSTSSTSSTSTSTTRAVNAVVVTPRFTG